RLLQGNQHFLLLNKRFPHPSIRLNSRRSLTTKPSPLANCVVINEGPLSQRDGAGGQVTKL
ncbi:MAG: hypothetical protein WBN53_20410, partial [Thermodesulfobacteriota bacterium]